MNDIDILLSDMFVMEEVRIISALATGYIFHEEINKHGKVSIVYPGEAPQSLTLLMESKKLLGIHKGYPQHEVPHAFSFLDTSIKSKPIEINY